MEIKTSSLTKACGFAQMGAGIILLILLSLLMVGCRPPGITGAKEKPAKVEKIEGSELSRITLTEKAIERIDLKTVAVHSEKVVRTRKVGGEVVKVVPAMTATTASAATASKITPASLRVKVSLSKGELSQVARGQSAKVVSFEQDDVEDQDDTNAEWAEVEDGEGDDDGIDVQYTVKGSPKLVAGQRVFIELPLSAAVQRSVIPTKAVIYDLKGDTWVYINTAVRTYLRHKVAVDYMDDETAVLLQGPPVGTQVVTDGVAELYGAEFGVGK